MFDKVKKAFSAEFNRFADSPQGYAQDEIAKIKEQKLGYAKENPVKASAAFFLLPVDWIIGAPLSIMATLGGTAYGVNKIANKKDGNSPK
jgi:hypothetical protein